MKDIEKAIQEKKFMFGIPGAGKGYGKFYKVLGYWTEVHGNGEIGEIRRQDRNTMEIEQDNMYNNDKEKYK